MKNVIKISLLFIILFASTIQSNAQLRTRTMAPINLGSYGIFGTVGSTVSGTGSADTLGVSDTISYIIQTPGIYQYTPYLSFGWTKIGSGTATLVASFATGNSPNNFNTVKAGYNNATYTKSFTLSASGTNFVDFLADSAKVSGRYLRVTYTTSSTAGVQGSIVTNINTAVK